MSTASKKPRVVKLLPIASLLCLVVASLLVWARTLSLPAFADPQDTGIRELVENRGHELNQQHGTLCMEIVHSTPDGTLLATDLDSSDPLPPKASALASEYGISGGRVGSTYKNSERLLIASTGDPRTVTDIGTSIVFEAVELQRFGGGAKGVVRWEVVHSEMMYPCDQNGAPIPLRQ